MLPQRSSILIKGLSYCQIYLLSGNIRVQLINKENLL
jgi:hypothetical protein